MTFSSDSSSVARAAPRLVASASGAAGETLGPVPALRVQAVNRAAVRPGRFVLYWMIAARRTRSSFALQHAIQRAESLGVPLVVLEALRVGYPWASPRLHRFVMDGMADQRLRFAGTPIAYHAYLEPVAGHGAGLLEALAGESSLVVTDAFPCFFLPRMVAAAGRKLEDLGVRLEAVDGNGLLPLAAADKTFYAAAHFRRFLQKELPRHLAARPVPDPLAYAQGLGRAQIPDVIEARWPAVPDVLLQASTERTHFLASLPIDHDVPEVDYRGGERAAEAALDAFLTRKLVHYAEARNEPEQDVPSGLSPYLHFGHIGVHTIVERVWEREGWSLERLAPKPNGAREGWWNMSVQAEGFLDELITWREIGYNFAHLRPDDYDRWESLPDWARHTMESHASDERPHLYTRDELEQAATHDPLWNAAQRQLRREGRIHNYLRMLWGKKILEWSASPQEALANLIALNNRWSTDGRNPNSYSGIFWTLGRFDRPWGPERKIFGTIRYMSSDNTAKKVRVKDYLLRYGPERSRLL